MHENSKKIKCTWSLYYFKNVLVVPHYFIKMFHLEQSYGILYSSWCNKSFCAYHELRQDDFYSFDQEKVPFLSSYLLLTQKKNLPQENSCLPKWFTIIRMLLACKTSDFFWLILLVRSLPSTNTLRFPHFLLMKTSLGKFFKFSIPSSSSSTITTFLKGYLLFIMKTWFSLKIKLERD